MTGDKIFKTIRESSLYTYNEIEKLIGRSEAIKRLAANYRGIAEEPPNFSSNCLLIGKGSIGKTLVGMYFGRGFRRIVIEGNIPLFIEYINCIHFRSKNQIFRELKIAIIKGLHTEIQTEYYYVCIEKGDYYYKIRDKEAANYYKIAKNLVKHLFRRKGPLIVQLLRLIEESEQFY